MRKVIVLDSGKNGPVLSDENQLLKDELVFTSALDKKVIVLLTFIYPDGSDSEHIFQDD